MLSSIINDPLSIEKLRTLLPQNSSAILYDTLRSNKKTRLELFKGNKTLVVLYEGIIDKKKQGHFVILIPRAHSIEYFSSLGRPPTDELKTLHVNPDAFKNILGTNYTYNRKRLQSDRYNVNDCAFWVLARAILWKMKLADFQKLFTPRSFRSGDSILALMSLLLSKR